MSINPEEFFKEKRQWSNAKDRILSYYLGIYLEKVKRFRKPILIVDCCAGMGKFADGTDGSPMIICKKLEEIVTRGYPAQAILIESNKKCFEELERNLIDFSQKGISITTQDQFCNVVPKIIQIASSCPMFFYIDPFGVKGLEFKNLTEIFNKVALSSTELLINFNFNALVRVHKDHREMADEVMGGDYYHKILSGNQSILIKEEIVVGMYKDKLKEKFPYLGSCPIKFKDDKIAKYHIIFATSHYDGFEIMNNLMADIFREFYSDGRLVSVLPTGKDQDLELLSKEVIKLLVNPSSRQRVKDEVFNKYFSRYKSSDINFIVRDLLTKKIILSDTGKIRINDKNILSKAN